MVELDGGHVLEPTAFEPDPNTHRQSFYYNALTNALYKRAVRTRSDGIRLYYWQQVSR